MKKLSICLSLMAMMLAYTEPLWAFQGGGGEDKTKKPDKKTPKSTEPSSSKSGTNSPRNPNATADLSIKTIPVGCAVLLNGQSRGSTNQEGFLNLSGLRPGNYTVTVRKAGHVQQQRTVTLYNGVNQQIAFSLAANPGSLSVNVSVAGAQIDVAGVGIYNNRVANLELHPGRYSITISKPGFRTTIHEAEIAPGKPETLTVSLSRISAEEMLTQVERDFRNRNYPTVIAVCRDIISSQPDNPRVNYLLGQSYYNIEQYSESVNYLVKAISLGETVTLPIKHHHRVNLGMGDALCNGELAFHNTGFKFNGACNQDFSIQFSKILAVKPESHKSGRLNVKVAITTNKKEEKKDYNFHVYQTGLRKLNPENPSSVDAVYCPNPNCSTALDALYQIFQKINK